MENEPKPAFFASQRTSLYNGTMLVIWHFVYYCFPMLFGVSNTEIRVFAAILKISGEIAKLN